MEDQLPSSPLAFPARNRAEVVTSRPFSSVKEAVAVFGERLFAGDAHVKTGPTAKVLDQNKPKPIYSLLLPPPKPVNIHSATSSPPSYSSASQFAQYRDDEHEFMFPTSLKKLESELEQTRRELMLLKERESKTEMVVMDLSAQLQRSMSMLAEIESVNTNHEITLKAIEDEEAMGSRIRSDRWREERVIRDYESSYEYLPTLAQAVSANGDAEDELSGSRRRMMKVAKKKPIIPLIGDLFSKKKESDDLSSSYYCRSIYTAISNGFSSISSPSTLADSLRRTPPQPPAAIIWAPMPDDDGRSRVRNLCIWAITWLFFIFLLAGGAILLLYIILPQSPSTMWFPVIGMVLVAVPWLFWFTTWVYRSTVTTDTDIEQPEEAARTDAVVAPSTTSTADAAAGSPAGGDDSPVEGGRRLRFGTTTVLGSEESPNAASDVESAAPPTPPQPSRGPENDGNSNATSGSSNGSSPNWHDGEEPPASSPNLDDEVKH